MRPVKKQSRHAVASISAAYCRRTPPDWWRMLDAVLVDNRFPEFVTAVCRAAQKRKIPIVIDLDQDDQSGRSTCSRSARTSCRRQKPCLERRASRIMEAHSRSSLNTFPASSRLRTGRRGSIGSNAASCKHLPAFKIKVIDSLGAGDAFTAVSPWPWRKGASFQTVLRFASATAALKCTKFGGASGAPTRAEVDPFLTENS